KGRNRAFVGNFFGNFVEGLCRNRLFSTELRQSVSTKIDDKVGNGDGRFWDKLWLGAASAHPRTNCHVRRLIWTMMPPVAPTASAKSRNFARANGPAHTSLGRYVFSGGERSRLGCTGRRHADRKRAGNLLLSGDRSRSKKVFGEGAEHNTRGRVCSPLSFSSAIAILSSSDAASSSAQKPFDSSWR